MWANAKVEELVVGISTVQRVTDLQALYTKRVVPDALVAHVDAVGAGAVGEEAMSMAHLFPSRGKKVARTDHLRPL